MQGILKRNASLPSRFNESLRRWEPWRELHQMAEEMDRLFDRAFSTPRKTWEGSDFLRFADLEERENELVIRVSLPDARPEDLHAEVRGDSLHIWGEKETRGSLKDKLLGRNYREYDSFDLRYHLPVTVDADRLEVTYRNGELFATLPKRDSLRPIPVKVEGGSSPSLPGTQNPFSKFMHRIKSGWKNLFHKS